MAPPRTVRIIAVRAKLAASANRLRFAQPAPRTGSTGEPVTSEISATPEFSWNSASEEVKVTVCGQARDALIRHCGGSNVHGCEVGGILVGYRYERTSPEGPVKQFVTLTDLIPVESCDRSEAHVRFDEDTWESIERQMNERFTPEGKCRLGWYHTHPSQGIFFSGQDRDAHTVFQRPYQFALVVDPRTMEAGVFYWLDYETRALAGPLRFALASAPVRVADAPFHVRRPAFRRKLYAVVPVCAAALAIVFFVRYYEGIRIPPAMNPGAVSAQVPKAPALLSPALLPPALLSPPVTSVAEPAAAVPAAAAPVSPEPIRLLVSEQSVKEKHRSHKDELRHIVIEAPGLHARLSYAVRGCSRARADASLASCRILEPGESEERFLGQVFPTESASNRTAFVKAVQQSLGLPDPHDGVWGARTRTAWLERALNRRAEPLRIALPGAETAVVIFQKK